ncbi:MAG TPA: hypothetical protein DGG94_03895 [Micromonosporaceae bacterium]|nr:hypothetical protein [Micromonosporaceae bacterium]HCU48942.1 hypothetical protein [Micromonosporaceae bacterium]
MIFAVPFVLALLVGAIGITRQAWRDEHATWWAATIPWHEFASQMSHVDIVLAPYYLFMRAWIFVAGDSVVAMRVPSLLAMAIAAGLTGVLGARLFEPWVGLTAGALFAVIPSVSRYAEEARPYAFAICFAVATLLALLSRRWVLLAVFTTLTGLSHLIALLVLLAHLPLLRRPTPSASSADDPHPHTSQSGADIETHGDVDHGAVRAWAMAVGVGLLPVLPLAFVGAGQAGQVSWISSSWKSLVTLPLSLTRSAATAGILAALALLGLLASRLDRRVVALIVWAAAPPLVVFAVTPQFFHHRYLLFTLPAWAMLAALSVRLLSGSRQKVAAAAMCTAILLLGGRDHLALRKSPGIGDQDYQAAAAYLSSHMSAGDEVLFDGYPDQRERFGFAYELRDRPTPRLCPNLSTCAKRVWLVSNRAPTTPPGFTVLDAQNFPGIELRLLTPAS